MGGKNSKGKDSPVKTDDVTLKEKEIEEKTDIANKEQKEADEAAKVAAKEKAEYDEAEARRLKEEEEAEAARLEALQAAGNLDDLVAELEKAQKELESANAFNRSSRQKNVEKLTAAVETAKKVKEEADAKAEKERLEAEEAARIAEKERLEAEEAARIAEKERLEAEAAAEALRKAKEEEERKAREEAEAKEEAECKAREEAEALAAAQKAREEAPSYHSGTLMKKGDDMVGAWKSRFFIARNSDLNFVIEYYDKENGSKKGSIDCHGYTTVAFSTEDIAAHGEFGIKLCAASGGRVWWLKADSEENQKEWLSVLSRACEKANYVEPPKEEKVEEVKEKVEEKTEDTVDDKVDEEDDVEDREVTPGTTGSRESVVIPGVPAGHIKCIKCDSIKPKADYSKSQQKNKKNAKCKVCTENA